MISYAQNAEDVVLDRCFRGQSTGFYVDVGAASPTIASVTRHFYELGWSGINIEPLADWVAELRIDRPRDETIQAVAGATRGRSFLYRVEDDEALSTTSRRVAERHQREGRPVTELLVQVVTLNEVLEQSSPSSIDFLKVDVEGGEADVFAGLDLDRWRPRVIVVEATEPNTLVSSADTFEPAILAGCYCYCSTDGVNRYYVREEDELLAPLLVPANSMDHYTTFREQLLNDEIDRLRVYARHLEEAVVATTPADSSGGASPYAGIGVVDATRVTDLDRLVVVGSPESGVGALAAALSEDLGIPLHAVEHPADVAWQEIRDRVILSVIWRYSDHLRSTLAANGFREIVVARHPLEVLLSVLRHSQIVAGRSQWLGAPDYPEARLAGADPASPEFIDWATSDRAAALLAVSADWWQEPAAIRVRFDELLSDPPSVLARVRQELDVTPRLTVFRDGSPRDQAGDALRAESLPAGWERYLTEEALAGILRAHGGEFSRLGLALPESHTSPTSEEVRSAWQDIGGEHAAL